MALKATMIGRDAVMRRLRELVPDAEKAAAKAQLEAAQDLAKDIAARAPVGIDAGAGDYKASIRAGRLADNPGKDLVGRAPTKDPNATGVFADYKWRWIEYGTKERFKRNGASTGIMPRKPHIFPTFRANRKRIRRKIANAINRAVRKAKG